MLSLITSKLKILLLSLIVCMVVGAIFIYSRWKDFLETPLIPQHEQPIDIFYPQGASVRSFAYKLHTAGALSHPMFFIFFAKLEQNHGFLKAGQYRVEASMKPEELLKKMQNGEAVLHAFTVVEGWTFREMIDAINKNPYVNHSLQNNSSDNIMELIGHKGEMPEGRFAADTYLFHAATSDIDLLKMAYSLQEKRLMEAWQNRAGNVPYKCPYSALIAASIIEKETARDNERPKVSGVIARRLKKNMFLGLCPTVIYGLGGEIKNGEITKEALIKDTAYNTYIHQGLPPTPISMPGEASIVAALHPEDSTTLYYVSKGDGSHYFSDSFEEHKRAISKYLRSK